ncbi:conserved hypothetical protein [Vibrio parahaemolyticus AQ3810]|nr:conserved hypothetical protein [Vibrio parahaemolyticus AQ3810]EXF66653.1 hypothetical protein D030_5430 [Vibrio parahaemolyticus AQ3810]
MKLIKTQTQTLNEKAANKLFKSDSQRLAFLPCVAFCV